MKYRDYKLMDLLILTILAVITEFLGYYLAGTMEVQLYLSFSIMIGLVSLLRWGAIGIIPFVAAGVPLVILKGMDLDVAILYEVVGNLFLIIPMLFFLKRNRDDIIKNSAKMCMFVILSLLTLCLGKGAIISIFEKDLSWMIVYLQTSMLSITINIILFAILYWKKSQLIRDMDSFIAESKIEED